MPRAPQTQNGAYLDGLNIEQRDAVLATARKGYHGLALFILSRRKFCVFTPKWWI